MTTTEATQALLPVTQADRDAAVTLIRLIEHRTEYLPEIEDGSYDENFFVQAFARHRISHSFPGDALRIAKTLLLAIDGIEAHCRNDAGLKGEDHAADGRRVRHAMNLLAEEARQQIAALTPSPCPGDGMRALLVEARETLAALDRYSRRNQSELLIDVDTGRTPTDLIAEIDAALTPSAPKEGFDREWCTNMAKKEAGYDIGAGVVAIDPTFPEQEGGE